MMGKIVDQQNTAKFALYVYTSLHAAKGFQGFTNGVGSDSSTLRDNNGCERVQDVVPAGGRENKFAKALAMMRYDKAHAVFFNRDVARNPIIAVGESVSLHLAQSFLCCTPQRRSRLRGVAPNHCSATPGHKIHQPPKCQFVSFEVWVN